MVYVQKHPFFGMLGSLVSVVNFRLEQKTSILYRTIHNTYEHSYQVLFQLAP